MKFLPAILLMAIVCALVARKMALTRGLGPAYWTALGFALGPLVFPFLLLSTGRRR